MRTLWRDTLLLAVADAAVNVFVGADCGVWCCVVLQTTGSRWLALHPWQTHGRVILPGQHHLITLRWRDVKQMPRSRPPCHCCMVRITQSPPRRTLLELLLLATQDLKLQEVPARMGVMMVAARAAVGVAMGV